PATRPGLVRGPPGPHRGTPMPPRTAPNWGLSPRWPAVTTIDRGAGHPRRPGAACSSAHPGSARGHDLGARCRPRPVLRVAGPPFAGAGGVLVGPGHRGIDADLPGDQALGVGLGLQGGEDLLPGAVALPAPEQTVDGLPWPIPLGHVPPRRAGPSPPADP